MMAIRIKTQSTADRLVGKSHWWGAPDLPPDIPYPYVMVGNDKEQYPEPLTFICQIRCKDIASFDTEGILPHTGMLYFFAPLDYFLGELDSPLDYHVPPHVIWSPYTERLKPYDLHWEDTNESVFRSAEKMMFSTAENCMSDGIVMLGTPYQEEVRQMHDSDVCLLQIDEDDRWGLRFYDCGMYYIFMRPEDVKSGRWDKATSELFYY